MNETKIRRTEITIETHSLTIIKMRGGNIDAAFCETCGRNVQILTTVHAALIFGAGVEFIEALLYSNQIHAIAENAVCAASLADYFKQKIRFVED
jgi:hypothetical protein